MDAIVNVTENWGIGLGNRLLVTISGDMRRFRALTEGKTVILGRKTLETFPNGRPLKNRRNIIMSTDLRFSADGAEVVHSVEELRTRIRTLPADSLCVIGGESVYRALLPYCARVLLTRTLSSPPADRFFPNLEELPSWELSECSETLEENGVRYRFEDYVNREPLAL